METLRDKSPFEAQTEETDILFPAWDVEGRYEGVYADAVRYVLDNDIMNVDNWKKFVSVFRTKLDTEKHQWRGEYWGKMMRGASWVYSCTRDEELYAILRDTVNDLLDEEDELGRISSYTTEKEFDGWDLWARKYILLGLQYFYEVNQDEVLNARIQASMERQVNYVIEYIGEEEGKKDITLATRNWLGANSCSYLEPVVRLYNLTKNERYLHFAEYIVNTGFCSKGDLIELAYCDEKAPYEYPQNKAYETMSCFEGLVEYYRVTGIEKYRTAALNFGRKVLETDVTVLGCSGCTHELFDHSVLKQTGTEYKGIMQETCVSVTWMKLCMQLLRLSGDPVFADCVERSFYNLYLGSFNTYRNEMVAETKKDLARITDPKKIPVPQVLPYDSYSPLVAGTRGRKVGGYMVFEDNSFYGCCACIGAAGTGLIPKGALLYTPDGICLNFFLPGEVSFSTPEGRRVSLQIETAYPLEGAVRIQMKLEEKERFSFGLRIPAWSRCTELYCNGECIPVEKGYTQLCREWKNGDTIEISLDMRVQAVLPPAGAMNEERFIAFQYGPLMLAQDARLGTDLTKPTEVICDEYGYVASATRCECSEIPDSAICFELTEADGGKQRLINYYSAGKTWDEDSACAVWIPRK